MTTKMNKINPSKKLRSIGIRKKKIINDADVESPSESTDDESSNKVVIKITFSVCNEI